MQKRIKDQQFPNDDLPKKGREKIDITIVVDMLLTGFDSKYLNTLYVDKNLKHHGLIQAFSRTNRVLNDTKPYGNILDFRGQQDAVDAAIALFSGEKTDKAREIWLVDKAPVVIEKLKDARQALENFMKSQGLTGKPEDVPNLKGDDARAAFIKHFKEVQRLKTQLDQYTDLTPSRRRPSRHSAEGRTERLPWRVSGNRPAPEEQQGKRAVTRANRSTSSISSSCSSPPHDRLRLHHGAHRRLLGQEAGQAKMSREQLIGLIQSDAKFMDERDDIAEYIDTLKAGEGLNEKAIREGYQRFKAEKAASELAAIAGKHGLPAAPLQGFVDGILPA